MAGDMITRGIGVVAVEDRVDGVSKSIDLMLSVMHQSWY